MKEKKTETDGIIVFLDGHVYTTPNWLSPLIETIQKHPKSLVYPAGIIILYLLLTL